MEAYGDITYWFLVAYIGGCVLAFVVIDHINQDEVEHGGSLFISELKALYSWAFIVYVLIVFADTWTKHRE